MQVQLIHIDVKGREGFKVMADARCVRVNRLLTTRCLQIWHNGNVAYSEVLFLLHANDILCGSTLNVCQGTTEAASAGVGIASFFQRR